MLGMMVEMAAIKDKTIRTDKIIKEIHLKCDDRF